MVKIVPSEIYTSISSYLLFCSCFDRIQLPQSGLDPELNCIGSSPKAGPARPGPPPPRTRHTRQAEKRRRAIPISQAPPRPSSPRPSGAGDLVGAAALHTPSAARPPSTLLQTPTCSLCLTSPAPAPRAPLALRRQPAAAAAPFHREPAPRRRPSSPNRLWLLFVPCGLARSRCSQLPSRYVTGGVASVSLSLCSSKCLTGRPAGWLAGAAARVIVPDDAITYFKSPILHQVLLKASSTPIYVGDGKWIAC